MITTNLHPIKDAARWKEANATNTWIVLGQTSPWESEPIPPPEDPTVTSINQAFCALQATIKWVIADPVDGSIPFAGLNGVQTLYSEITTLDNLVSSMSPLVLFVASTTGAQLASLFGNVAPTWRQIGVFTDLVPVLNYGGANFLTPNQISDWGQIEAIENRGPITLPNSGAYYTVQTLISYGVTIA